MNQQGATETRVYPRYAHAEPVQFQFKNPSHFGGCLSRDLSEGGVRIRLNDYVPENTELMLKIRLADGNVIECVGTIAWIEKVRFADYYHAGLKFSEKASAIDIQKKIQQSLSRRKHLSSSFMNRADSEEDDTQKT